MKSWTREELRLALALYCQLPFGRMHARNPEIVSLSARIGRTPSAVAMKLVNFASLDPQIAASGRKGLGNASALDRLAWAEFQADWDCGFGITDPASCIPPDTPLAAGDAETTALRMVEVRTKQLLFRRVVLSSYSESCCVSGLSEKRLLVASHIIPWSIATKERLNPTNGLCMSALHDKAFDCGLMTVLPDMTVKISEELKRLRSEPFIRSTLIDFEGRRIREPEKFYPKADFLHWHNENVFLG